MVLLIVRTTVEVIQIIRLQVVPRPMETHALRTVIVHPEICVLLRDIVFPLIKCCAPTLIVQMAAPAKILLAKKAPQITLAHQIVIAVLEDIAQEECAKTTPECLPRMLVVCGADNNVL